MSDLNCEWLIDNFKGTRAVIFDIGTADLSDSIRFKRFLPDATIYSFEPSPMYQTDNITKAKEWDIHYFGMAMSDRSGVATFYPGNPDVDPIGRYIGTLIDAVRDDVQRWLDPVTVKTTCINDFCLKHNVAPDFIHIDAEGAEELILSNMMPAFRPKAVWSERDRFTPEKLKNILEPQGYHCAFVDKYDELHVSNKYQFSDYQPFSFEKYKHNSAIIIPLEYETRRAEWLKSYNNIKDPSWPILTKMEEFENLPDLVKQECKEVHNFDIDPTILEGNLK